MASLENSIIGRPIYSCTLHKKVELKSKKKECDTARVRMISTAHELQVQVENKGRI